MLFRSVTSPTVGDTVAVTGLHFWLTDTLARYLRYSDGTRVAPAVMIPLFGATDSDLKALQIGGLAFSPTSRDSRRPGVGVGPSDGHSLDFILGGAGYEDAGALFFAYSVSAHGFRGMWADGGNVSPSLSGYFCAQRR